MKKLFLVLLFALIASACDNVASKSGSGSPDDMPKSGASKSASEYPNAPATVMLSEIELLGGDKIKIGDFKGKVVLVNLWATWCGPCRMEIPELVKLQEKYPDELEIIGLDVDPEEEELIQSAIKEMKMNYKVGWLSPELRRGFGSITPLGGIPMSFLINHEGRIRGVFKGSGQRVISSMRENVIKAVSEQQQR